MSLGLWLCHTHLPPSSHGLPCVCVPPLVVRTLVTGLGSPSSKPAASAEALFPNKVTPVGTGGPGFHQGFGGHNSFHPPLTLTLNSSCGLDPALALGSCMGERQRGQWHSWAGRPQDVAPGCWGGGPVTCHRTLFVKFFLAHGQSQTWSSAPGHTGPRGGGLRKADLVPRPPVPKLWEARNLPGAEALSGT